MKTRQERYVLVWVLFFGILSGCSKPILTTVQPSTAYPRQILSTDGSGLFTARAVWDHDLPSETDLNTSFLSGRYFQLPDVASTGNHPLAMRTSEGTSDNVVMVNVLAPSGSWPNPRIQEIMINNVFNDNGTDADYYLAIAVANGDADAVVTINGTDVPTILTSAISTDYFNMHIPATYGYPIYHYSLHVAFLENQNWGSTVQVALRNHDGSVSPQMSYTFPSSIATVDSDNDGLLDQWEENGYTAASGTVIDLKALGCDPKRKDLLVEVDWITAATPDPSIWTTIEAVFDQAPILNPNGSSGIEMHLDRGQGGVFTGGGTVLSDHTSMDFGPNPMSPGYTDFYTYKNSSFNTDRLDLFHYGIFGRARPNGSSGRGEVFGNDFMVTFANFTGLQAFATPRNQIGTFIHELGHNLDLCHAGSCDNPDRNETLKVNQPSSMNYLYQFPAVSLDCDLISDNAFGYSQGMLATLDETNVTEANGICDNLGLDFNSNGSTNNTGVINLNGDSNSTDISIDYNEWGAIRLDYRAAGSSWNNN
ncbi:hypothetical protein [uncultured Dokdonia sp.]|uniref:hypothetical protein n=1 Tax=uncultured Dokdonia sp. TaxID=575653 RepID=UPI0026201192|nr:hypothetical protein [uncultured Dokdonia sp.]